MHLIPSSSIRVLVCYAEPLLAIGLSAALRGVDGLHVATAGARGAAATDEVADVVVTDLPTAIELLTRQRRGQAGALERARVLVVAAETRENDVRIALERGVHGCLQLDCAVAELEDAIRAVARGAKYLGREVAQRMAESLTREALTARETQVLGLLARGDCNKSIARRLDISVGTVKTHVKAIMCKLDADSRTHAVTIAARRGLVERDRLHDDDAPLRVVRPFDRQPAGDGGERCWA